jgi:hypothetical protein
VGRRSDAIDLYRQRKADVRAGVKLPSNLRTKGARFSEIAGEAGEWYVNHGKKDLRTVKLRMKRLVKDFGTQVADTISPAQIDQWLSKQAWTPATCNRYKALLSKTFKIALAAGKVSINPARLVEQRTESPGRIRYLLDDEETIVRTVINKRCPDHMEEFEIALNTGAFITLLLVPVFYSIFVLDLKWIKWEIAENPQETTEPAPASAEPHLAG